MQKFNGSLVRQFPSLITGNAAAGVSVTVFIGESGSTLATLFSGNGVNQIANPITTDSAGYYGFYAADGVYRLRFGVANIPDQNIQLLDSLQVVNTITGGSGLIGQAASYALQSITANQDAVQAATDAALPSIQANADYIAQVAIEAQTGVEDAEAAALAAQASALTAASSATVAANAANFKGNWSALTGALSVPSSVYHNGFYYNLITNTASVQTNEPGVSAIWVLADSDSRLKRLDGIFKKATLSLYFAKNDHKVYEQFGLEPKQLTDVITTTRASSATYNSPFGVATAAANVPRITYDPATGEALGLLCEEQRTNLVLRSEDFTQSNWTKQSAAVSLSASEISPVGALATIYTATSTTTPYLEHTAISYVSGTFYVASIFIKARELSQFSFLFGASTFNPSGGSLSAAFNLTTGTITNQTVTYASITPYPNGWYRVSAGHAAGATVTNNTGIQWVRAAGSVTNGQGYFISGAQLEGGSFPTSYIKTESSQVTRVDDLMPAFMQHNESQFSVFGDFGDLKYISGAPSKRILSIGNNNSDRIEVSNNTVVFSAGGATQTYTIPIGLRTEARKIAYSYFNGLVKIFINGDIRHTFTQAVVTTMPSNRLSINYGAGSSLTTVASIIVKDTKYFPRALTDAELIELTRL
jgi:hypothetical protein